MGFNLHRGRQSALKKPKHFSLVVCIIFFSLSKDLEYAQIQCVHILVAKQQRFFSSCRQSWSCNALASVTGKMVLFTRKLSSCNLVLICSTISKTGIMSSRLFHVRACTPVIIMSVVQSRGDESKEKTDIGPSNMPVVSRAFFAVFKSYVGLYAVIWPTELTFLNPWISKSLRVAKLAPFWLICFSTPCNAFSCFSTPGNAFSYLPLENWY